MIAASLKDGESGNPSRREGEAQLLNLGKAADDVTV
jgi:hypothetical protein